jgi:hypothetical protein
MDTKIFEKEELSTKRIIKENPRWRRPTNAYEFYARQARNEDFRAMCSVLFFSIFLFRALYLVLSSNAIHSLFWALLHLLAGTMIVVILIRWK